MGKKARSKFNQRRLQANRMRQVGADSFSRRWRRNGGLGPPNVLVAPDTKVREGLGAVVASSIVGQPLPAPECRGLWPLLKGLNICISATAASGSRSKLNVPHRRKAAESPSSNL
jgi:hypothetical protein